MGTIVGFLDTLRRANARLAELYEDVGEELTTRGWYVGPNLSNFEQLKKAIQEGLDTEIEEFLCGHVRRRAPEVKEQACTRWGARKAILADAFCAHEQGKYTLSVPAFLAQADGITKDIFEASLFSNRTGKIAEKAESTSNEYPTPLGKAFFLLLTHPSMLRLNSDKHTEGRDAGENISPLNRQKVLHGIGCDYATEPNSLRAIALLDFLNWAAEAKDNITQPNEDA